MLVRALIFKVRAEAYVDSHFSPTTRYYFDKRMRTVYGYVPYIAFIMVVTR